VNIPARTEVSRARTILALDAAYGPAAACLALPDGSRLTAETSQDMPHSQSILPMLHKLLDQAGCGWQQLDLLALGTGPGSFTGLRVSAAIMAGINSSFKLPVLSVSSLAVTALQTEADDEIRIVEDARSGAAYFGCYRQAEALQSDQCLPWDAIVSLSAMPYASQTGLRQPLPDWQRLPLTRSRPRALARLVMLSAERVDVRQLPRLATPFYMQPSQAERKTLLA